MLRRYIICLSLALIPFSVAFAQTDTLGVVVERSDAEAVEVVVDSLSAAEDTSVLSDEDFRKAFARQQQDTVRKVVDRGRDVSRLVNSRRQRSADVTTFVSEKFMDNTFLSVRGKSLKLATKDYSFGMLGGVAFGKWFHKDHAVRVNADFGRWYDNFSASRILGTELTASYLFNVSSYVGGYRTNRLCEFSVVAGAGYANSLYMERFTHAFTGHVGVNMNLRLFKDVDFFIEPLATMYTNGMAVSNAYNWRKWMAAFQGSFGLTYNFSDASDEESPALLPRTDGWFISLMGGPHFQNSREVYELGLGDALGVHVDLGVGKYYTDYFAMRFSAAYSRGGWLEYATTEGGEQPCNYFAVRAEGMFDVLTFVMRCLGKGKEGRPFVSASVLFGPEMGYMYKRDIGYMNIERAYIGLCGGLQASLRLTPRFSLFAEPRFSIIPYDAPNDSFTTNSDNRNYYDGILNFNLGIEFIL